ncbi:TIGR02285 family protein [Pseudomonas sp. LD120]|uniref:TIGR02285 family protein n=1 Tax=Pseudomonas sp. LD120 TaxID=485751 RepID=UPI0021139B3F|nr:TIGR02285 family protein [Pseudomonas sp. LD120]
MLVLFWPLCASSEPQETLIWLMRDLPPSSIFEGELKGRGVIDLLMPQLIASLPEYQQQVVRVNRARGMQMLRESTFVCDPAMIKTKEREQWITFSITSFRVLSNGLVIRRADRKQLARFIQNGKVDLHALLNSGEEKVGVIAERSYGQHIDSLLQQAPVGTINAHHGNEALGSLLQMQRLGRLRSLLGYLPEVRYLAIQQGIDPQDLEFYPIQGIPKYQEVHIGCSKTAQGQQAIARLNQTLLTLREDRLVELYAQWLEPGMRDEYRAEARAYFQGLKAH